MLSKEQCVTPSGGLPSIVDASQIKTLQASLAQGAVGLDDTWIVQAPQPVPAGKHWIVTQAKAMGTPVGFGPVVNTYSAIFMANAAAMGQVNGSVLIGATADMAVLMRYLRSIQAVLLATIQEGYSAGTPLFDLAEPFAVIPAGFILAALVRPAVGGILPFEFSMSFSYLQRDNAPC